MSTPTAIEIVRAQCNWWKHELCGFPPHTQDELYGALASVPRNLARAIVLAAMGQRSDIQRFLTAA